MALQYIGTVLPQSLDLYVSKYSAHYCFYGGKM